MLESVAPSEPVVASEPTAGPVSGAPESVTSGPASAIVDFGGGYGDQQMVAPGATSERQMKMPEQSVSAWQVFRHSLVS